MKKIVERETQFCDACNAATYCDSCLGCGSEHCYECRKKLGVGYNHSVYFQGSGDGYYCDPCDRSPKVQRTELHRAYVAIKLLSEESERFYADFKKRAEAAEKRLKGLRNE